MVMFLAPDGYLVSYPEGDFLPFVCGPPPVAPVAPASPETIVPPFHMAANPMAEAKPELVICNTMPECTIL